MEKILLVSDKVTNGNVDASLDRLESAAAEATKGYEVVSAIPSNIVEGGLTYLILTIIVKT